MRQKRKQVRRYAYGNFGNGTNRHPSASGARVITFCPRRRSDVTSAGSNTSVGLLLNACIRRLACRDCMPDGEGLAGLGDIVHTQDLYPLMYGKQSSGK